MPRTSENILIIQTAFIGDVVLTLPLIQVCKRFFQEATIDVVAIPRTAEILKTHPAIRDVIVYDKRGTDKGIRGMMRVVRLIRSRLYDLALVPHRSLQSAIVARLGNIPMRIGFNSSEGAFLFSMTVRYKRTLHEIERDLSLLTPLGAGSDGKELPNLYPADDDKHVVDQLLSEWNVREMSGCVAIAPGSVWNTKRWLEERFVELSQLLVQNDFAVILVGGPEDVNLCERIQQRANSSSLFNASGRLSVLQSAELIGRCKVLVSNDSAPMHLAVAMRTPVVAIFGPTVPEFGFAPQGERDTVVQIKGLRCRPCSIHGGNKCPIKTFDCMVGITSQQVYAKIEELIGDE